MVSQQRASAFFLFHAAHHLSDQPAQRAFSSIIVITINIWLSFHDWRQIWLNEVKCLIAPGSIPDSCSYKIKHFWIIFLLFKNSPNFGIFSMTPLLSGNYRKHRIFSDESRDTKEGLHIFFIAGTRWYVHELSKSGSLQMFTSHK